MGWKYEVSIYEKNEQRHYEYRIVYAGNSRVKAFLAIHKHRNHPCVQLVIR